MKNTSYPAATAAHDHSSALSLIDFRSDTVTRPTAQMRQVMADAPVGDDVYAEDPTINALQQKVAQLLNKEAALFVPSGTMSNLLALLSHCQRGEEVIVGDQNHIFSHEAGGASILGGIAMQSLSTTAKGYITTEQIQQAIRPDDIHFAQSKLICLENTVSGFVQPQTELDAICHFAHDQQLKTHLDGARLMHAVVKTGNSAAQLTAHFDSVSLCLSKGLGAPAGSVLSGSKTFIQRATRLRKLVGGGMRQAGILAAAGIYALDNHVERLQDDHDLALYFAQQLNNIDLLDIDLSAIETNMLFVHFPCAANSRISLAEHLKQQGIIIGDTSLCRLVVHLDICKQDIEKTVTAIREYYSH